MTLSCDQIRDLAPAFVLGALDAAEDAAVRAHLASCPQAHEEIEELGGVVPYLADTLDPVEPPPGLRARILDAAAREPSAASIVPERIAAVAPTPRAAEPRPAAWATARAPSTRTLGTWALRLAAVFAIVALGAWNLQLQSSLNGTRADLDAARAYQQGVAAVLEIGTRPGADTAFLGSAGTTSTASGVAATAPDGTMVLALRGLAATTGSQVYEAWVIVGTNPPVALGGFTVAGDGTGVLRTQTSLAAPGATVAVTLEPLPGATAPAGPLVSAGSLVAAAS